MGVEICTSCYQFNNILWGKSVNILLANVKEYLTV